MTLKATSKPAFGSSQSFATIGFEASNLGVIRIIKNQSRPFCTLLDILLPKLLSGELSSNHLEQ